MYAIIMAGGTGTRLWPLSRKNKPKQNQCVLGDKTLLQATFARIKKLVQVKNIIITTGRNCLNLICQELPGLSKSNFSTEPSRQDTAPALGLVGMLIEKRNPEAIMVNINSDAYVKDENEYRRILALGEKITRENPEYTVAIGIEPQYPETGYGYIKKGRLFQKVRQTEKGKEDEIYYVDSFKEKPVLEKAKKFVESGQYLWNPTLFFWKVKTFIQLLKKYQPKMYAQLSRIQNAVGTKNYASILEKEYKEIEPISIDYAIIEKNKKMLVIPAEFGWSDVGHWQSVQEILANEKGQNVVQAKEFVSIDTENSLIYAPDKKVVAVVGLKDMIVVDSPDALLVCPKSRAQEVKQVVKMLEEKGKGEYI